MNSSRSLKVLHLTTHLNLGGITSYILTLSKALSQKGHRCSVLSSGGSQADELAYAGIPGYVFPIKTKSILNPKLYLALPRMVKAVKDGQFNILHAHSRVTQVLAFWISKETGIPFISTAHGFYKARLGRRIFPCWGRRVVAISSLVAEELQKSHGVSKKKIRIVHNALDLDHFQKKLAAQNKQKIRDGLGIPDGAYVLGSVSRLVRDKGHEVLLAALQEIKKTHPQVFLVIVGDGRERERLENKIREFHLTGSVRMIKGVSETASILPAFDLFVHPATYREGFGLSIAEAMAARLPVLTTDIPAINTLFHDGIDSCIVKPKNAAALAGAIEKFMSQKAWAQNIAQGGYDLAVQLCQPERMASETEAVYLEVLRNA